LATEAINVRYRRLLVDTGFKMVEGKLTNFREEAPHVYVVPGLPDNPKKDQPISRKLSHSEAYYASVYEEGSHQDNGSRAARYREGKPSRSEGPRLPMLTLQMAPSSIDAT
jgi:hypothetical protein